MKALVSNLKINQLFLPLIYGVAFTLPLNQSLNAILSVGLILVVFFKIVNDSNTLKSLPKSVLILIVPFILYLLNTVVFDFTLGGFSLLIKKITLLFFPLIFCLVNLSKKQQSRVLHFFIYGLLSSFFICILIAIYKNIFINEKILYGVWGVEMTQRFYSEKHLINWPYYVYTELVKPLGFSPIYMGIYCVFGALASLHFYFKKRTLKYLLFFLVILIYVVLVSSRNGLILFSILVPFLLLFKLRRKRKLFILLSGSILLSIIVILNLSFVKNRFKSIAQIVVTLGSTKNQDFTKDINNERLVIWQNAIELIKEKPLFGYKIKEYNLGLSTVSDKKSAHSMYLETMLLFGFVGLSLFFIFYFVCFKKAVDTKNLLYFLFLFLFLFSGFTESLLNRQQGVIFIAFFNSFFFYSNHKQIE